MHGQDLFYSFDGDNSGSISKDELVEALERVVSQMKIDPALVYARARSNSCPCASLLLLLAAAGC